MPLPRARCWIIGVVLFVSCSQPKGPTPVLLPGAAEPIQRAFASMAPALRYEQISIDRDHVLARLCAPDGLCFRLRLDPPGSCAGTLAGPVCVSYTEGTPTAAHRTTVEDALRALQSTRLWSAVPKARPAPAPLGVLLVLLGILGLVPGALSAVSGRDGRLVSASEILCAAGIAVVAFFWLERVNSGGAGPGTFLYVLDCLLFDQCFTIGPGSSVILNNGAVWPDLLLGLRYWGGSAALVGSTVNLLLAVGLVVVAVVVSRFLRPGLGAPAAMLALAMLAPLLLGAVLIDCSVTFLFCVGMEAGLLIFALTESSVALLFASVFMAHAMGAHTSATSLLPGFFFIPLLGSNPRRSMGLAVSGFLASTAIVSWDAMIANVQIFIRPMILPFLLMGAVALILVARRFRPAFAQARSGRRALIVAACFLVPHLAGIAALLVIQHPVLLRYLPPVVGPLAAVLALLLAWPIGSRWKRFAFMLPLAVALAALGYEAHRESASSAQSSGGRT